MKKLLITLVIPLLALSWVSCNKVNDTINEATTTTVTTDVVIPINAINGSGGKGDIVFSNDVTHYIPNNATIKKYLSSISNLEVVGIKIKIIEALPNDMVLKNASFTLKRPDENTAFECSTPANFPLTANSVYTVSENEANWSIVNNIIKELGNVQLISNGIVSANSEDVKVQLEYVITVKATVNANL